MKYIPLTMVETEYHETTPQNSCHCHWVVAAFHHDHGHQRLYGLSTRCKEKNRKAQVYLKTDVCTNTQYRSILGEYSQCDESEKIVETSPYVAAMYRVAHDFNTYCKSHVDRLWHFIEHNLWYIAGGSIALGFVIIKYISELRWENYLRSQQLPHQRFSGPQIMRIKDEHDD